MEFKSKIAATNQPIISIQTTSVYTQNSTFSEEKINIKNGKKECITSTNLIADGIVILDTQMHFLTPQTILSEITGESIVMNFICCNNVEAIIDNVETEKYTTANTHNILYTSNFIGSFEIPAFEEINYLSIVLSLDFYSKLINENWDIHQDFSKSIRQKKSDYLTSKYAPFNPAIQWTIHEIKNCKYEGGMKKMYLEAKIKELLILQLETLMVKPQEDVLIGQEDYEKLQKAKLILDENFTSAPTLSELSRIISLNEFKLKKGFKACFQTTVKGYITKLRMEYAKSLFKNKTSNVSEVAEKCGYKDVSHFSSAFKLFYGSTPVSFRKNYLKINFSLLYWEFFDVVSLEFFMI